MGMMLARVADALYWTGRYIERAENVARLLMMTSEFCVELDGLDEGLAQAEWNGVLRGLLGADAPAIRYDSDTGLSLPFFRALLTDPLNPASVLYSVERARDNARSVGEALTREVYTNLNALGQQLRSLQESGLNDPASGNEAVDDIHRRILTLLGAIEHTLTRDSGWTYLKLGEAMERAQRTATVLRLKLPPLLMGEEHDGTLRYALARQLLLSLASLENFRRVHGAALEGESVGRFLIFDTAAPRALACCTERMLRALESLSKSDPGIVAAGRAIGRLRAELQYEEESVMESATDGSFFDRGLSRLFEAHDAITQHRRRA